MHGWLARFVDIRRGELRAVAQAFATLFLILSAYTVLETARDVLLLTRLPLRDIGVAYIAAAIVVLPASGMASRASQWFGVRRALVGGLVVAAILLGVLFVVPTSGVSTVAIYAVCSLVGAILVPLFWSLVGSIFTVVQGRRLLGPIAAAGALGAAVGSGAAAGILTMVHTKRLLIVSAVMFALTSVFVFRVFRAQSDLPKPASTPRVHAPRPLEIYRQEPFVGRIALLALASTAAVVSLDYFFKWTVARNVSHEHVARFIAVYYAGLNGVALVAQLLGTGALVRRVGVAAALVVTPFLLFCGASGAWIAGGALVVVLVLKTTDGLLRNSVHRIATELIYLPVRSSLRSAAKPFIDGALSRVAQASVGAVLLALGNAHYLAARPLAAGVVMLLGVWLILAVTTRRPYLALLSRAIATDSIDSHPEADPVDLESAEELVQHLADEDPLTVIGAMTALARRGRQRLIPALVLLYQDEAILLRALAIFGESERDDWVTRARRLLRDPRETLRIAAARALAVHNRLQVSDLDGASGPRLRGYAALHFAREHPELPVLGDARIAAIIARLGEAGEESRLGLLFAIADAPRDERLLPLLGLLEGKAGESREWTEGLARAATAQHAEVMIPMLISRLTEREGREAIRATLVSFDQPALDELWTTLLDSSRDRALRLQLPSSIARFGTKRAAELLLETIESEGDGRVRYKAIRGLNRLVVDHHVDVERARVERLAYANMLEYFRILGLRVGLSRAPAVSASVSVAPAELAARSPAVPVPPRSTTERLLAGLLDDKLRQSLERVFRLLKIAHPRLSIHRVYVALVSKDLRARANAAEFLDTLLRRPDQRLLRRLFQVLEDDLSDEQRITRVTPLLNAAPPRTRQEALDRLTRDSDATVSALAIAHLAEAAGEPMNLEIGGLAVSVGRVPVQPPAAGAHAASTPDA
jgi:ATP:ADP antiporter, AAA family